MRRLLAAVVCILILSDCSQAADDEPILSSITLTADQARPEASNEVGTTISAAAPSAIPGVTDAPEVHSRSTVEENQATLSPSLVPATIEPSSLLIETPTPHVEPKLQEYPVPSGSRPHDVAPAPDGTVWYTAQRRGALGRLDPLTGETHHIPLGTNSAPHGVIVGPNGAAWVTDSGLNAIVRVDPETEEVVIYPLPAETGNANLNTATFDGKGILWFTGQNGFYGSLNIATGVMDVYDAPHGRGPYGITTTPNGDVYFASLAGSYVGRINPITGEASVLEPPTPGQGARRVWSDSRGRIWVSEWNAGQLAMLDPATGEWQEWPLPGERPMPYAVYVDDRDMVWLSDFGANALVRFDPLAEEFQVFPLPSPGADVRQILSRPGEIWGAESGTDKLVVIRTH